MIRIKDLTSGNPVRLILVFALPVLTGNMLQQFYNLVDSLITGQNYGAGRMDRVRLGLRRSAQIGFLLALTVGGLMTVFGKSILSLFIRDEAELADQVLAIGYDFLRVMAAGLPMLYLLFVYRTTLQGLGDTVMPMISGFLELALRVGAALLLPAILGYWGGLSGRDCSMDWCGSFSDHGLLSSTAQADKYRGRNKMTRYCSFGI